MIIHICTCMGAPPVWGTGLYIVVNLLGLQTGLD